MGRSRRVDDEEILRAIAVASAPVVTAPELADAVGYSADNVRIRLQEMESQGYVKSREVGARAVVWWLTTDGREQLHGG